jgi:uncharacterized protein (TIGR03437 family)
MVRATRLPHFGADGRLLTTLGGASVTFNGIAAPVFSSFPGQLNVQIPPELTGVSASVVVTVGGQMSAPQTVALAAVSPGIFSTSQKGSGQGVIQIANTNIFAAAAGSIPEAQTRAVKPGESITIYCAGLGAVNNTPAPGMAASDHPLSSTKIVPKVTIGGMLATVSFAGLSPGFVGLYQVNAQIPLEVPAGSAVNVQLSIAGKQSNVVTIAVAGPTGSKIAAGEGHTCAVTNAGEVLCWGANQSGQLGNGTTTSSTTPVRVIGLPTDVVAITAGQNFTCALTRAGGVLCWGSNTYDGSLGNGSGTDSNVPVRVLDLTGKAPLGGVVAISAGNFHTCALTSIGAVLCWGSDGVNTTNIPVGGFGLSNDVAAISAGSLFTCAVTTSGNAQCWGSGIDGQLGNGNNYASATAVAVLNPAGSAPLTGVAAIAAGYDDACALTSSGTVLCWGGDGAGELGNGAPSSTPSNIPTRVLDVTGKSALTGIAAVTEGLQHTCALTNAGAELCWGDNAYGALGAPGVFLATTPVPVSGLSSGVIAIAAGFHHNCDVTSEGGVLCWGFNIDGQLGNGSSIRAFMSPVAVVGVGESGS